MSDEVQKVRLHPDPASITTPGERATMELLLELCDSDLDVETTSAEVRELLELYQDMYQAKPFVGLRELIEADSGIALFFEMFRQQILPLKKVEERRQKIFSMYSQFVEAATRHPQTPQLQALRSRAYGMVLFHLNYRLMIQAKKPRKVWTQ